MADHLACCGLQCVTRLNKSPVVGMKLYAFLAFQAAALDCNTFLCQTTTLAAEVAAGFRVQQHLLSCHAPALGCKPYCGKSVCFLLVCQRCQLQSRCSRRAIGIL